jgi:hypothetical protein
MYFKLADGSNMFLRNFGSYVKDNVMSKLRRLQDEQSPPENLHGVMFI